WRGQVASFRQHDDAGWRQVTLEFGADRAVEFAHRIMDGTRNRQRRVPAVGEHAAKRAFEDVRKIVLRGMDLDLRKPEQPGELDQVRRVEDPLVVEKWRARLGGGRGQPAPGGEPPPAEGG